jgi:hypothetical protein
MLIPFSGNGYCDGTVYFVYAILVVGSLYEHRH